MNIDFPTDYQRRNPFIGPIYFEARNWIVSDKYRAIIIFEGNFARIFENINIFENQIVLVEL